MSESEIESELLASDGPSRSSTSKVDEIKTAPNRVVAEEQKPRLKARFDHTDNRVGFLWNFGKDKIHRKSNVLKMWFRYKIHVGGDRATIIFSPLTDKDYEYVKPTKENLDALQKMFPEPKDRTPTTTTAWTELAWTWVLYICTNDSKLKGSRVIKSDLLFGPILSQIVREEPFMIGLNKSWSDRDKKDRGEGCEGA